MTNLVSTILLAASLGLSILTITEYSCVTPSDTQVCGEPTGNLPPTVQ